MTTYINVNIGPLLQDVRKRIEFKYTLTNWAEGWISDCKEQQIKPYSVSTLLNYTRSEEPRLVKPRTLRPMLEVIGLQDLLEDYVVES